MTETQFKNIKQLPTDHLLAAGTALCAGCGGLEALKEAYDVLGEKSVLINAAGCMTLLSIYPFTPFRGSWLYAAMGATPAAAQGVRDALDILIDKGRLPPEEDLQVVTLTGDGAAADIGMASTSGAIERGLDFLYFCYDNEGYGNTGQQYSPTTPFAAQTATSRFGHRGKKKDLFTIWAAHKPAYVATVIGAEPLDLARKVEKAKGLKGPRLIIALAPCPTGWSFDPKLTVEVGRMAVKSGVWPLKEYVDGEVVHTKIPAKRVPVEEYLKLQGRFRHLFEPERDEEALARIQREVDEYWAKVTGEGA